MRNAKSNNSFNQFIAEITIMTKVPVGMEQYKRSFKEHKLISDYCLENNVNLRAAKLYMLLFYSVECGLKTILYEIRNKEKFSKDDIEKELETHKIGDYMKKCKISNPGVKPESLKFMINGNFYKLPDIHHAWRYGAKIHKEDERKIVSFLNDIYEEVERRVDRI